MFDFQSLGSTFDRRTFLEKSIKLALMAGQSGLAFGSDFFKPSKEITSNYLKLAPGFNSHLIEKQKDPMSDGLHCPGKADGMASFKGPKLNDGTETVILMRNHEVSIGDSSNGPYPDDFSVVDRPNRYSKMGYGGVSRVVLNARTFQKISSNLVLEGTIRNCAGGYSPWGWLSCEETILPGHGYVFLCPTSASQSAPLRKLPQLGRFNHEACAVDPTTNQIYLTEDRDNGCLYRFTAKDAENDPLGPGVLEALCIVGRSKAKTEKWADAELEVGFNCSFTPLKRPDSLFDTLRLEAQSQSAAIFRRGEGIFYFAGSIYFACTNGGPAEKGQIFKFTPADNQLKLIGFSPKASTLDCPDNICVSSRGFVYMVEDSSDGARIQILTPKGKLFTLGQNTYSSSELAGVCFSPDEKALFLNIQHDGLTLAITGNFKQLEEQLRTL